MNLNGPEEPETDREEERERERGMEKIELARVERRNERYRRKP